MRYLPLLFLLLAAPVQAETTREAYAAIDVEELRLEVGQGILTQEVFDEFLKFKRYFEQYEDASLEVCLEMMRSIYLAVESGSVDTRDYLTDVGSVRCERYYYGEPDVDEIVDAADKDEHLSALLTRLMESGLILPDGTPVK